jgi:hypothetical protein
LAISYVGARIVDCITFITSIAALLLFQPVLAASV